MKKIILLFALLTAIFTTAVFAQSKSDKMVTLYFKNINFYPKKFTLISYAPNETGNGTNGYFIFPGFKKTVNYKVGTKIYLASDEQVGVVMSGKRIDAENPFLVVAETDQNKTFSLK